MHAHHLLTQRTARYYTIGETTAATHTIWLACHGYAQLAGEFIRQLEPLAEKNVLIVAPEALSRFYTKGFYGTVGATWMTKEDREAEIEDYAFYLQKLLEEIKSRVSPHAKMHALGFSQGCSTVCRWVAMKSPLIHSLWLCSGNIPEDLDFEKFRAAMQEYPAYLIVGDDDPFIQEKDRQAVAQRISEHRLPVKVHAFKGGHDLNIPLLKSLSIIY